LKNFPLKQVKQCDNIYMVIFLRRRQRIIIISIVSALFAVIALCLTGFLLTFKVEVSLNGAKTVSTEVFSEFDDQGAKAYISLSALGIKKESKTVMTDNIDNQKLGTYKKEYKASFLGKQATVSRNVNVIDVLPPEILVEQETIRIDFKENPDIDIYNLPIKYTATDLYDGDLTNKVVKTYEKDGCLLAVSDSSGNLTSLKVMFDYVDKQAPKITLENKNTLYLTVGEKYSEITYTAIDEVDGDITNKVTVSGSPDTSKAGKYTVKYSVTDSSNNTGYAERKVVVYKKTDKKEDTTVSPSTKTVYLTFDDGPGKYTEQLLKILKGYDVKATFFVTDQFPKYRDLIGKAYADGHSIGAHTFSHRFDNIYRSIENYLKDFEKIQAIIKEQTGQESKIFRFPGGSSNSVSQKYSTGIMKALVNEMNKRGYTYFDWNYDCGDTSGYKKKQIVNSVLKHIKTRLKTENYTIILLHDIKAETIKAVPEIIEYCLEQGYTLAGLDETSPNRQFAVKN